MKTVKIILADGVSPRTANVEMSNAETHIAARDRFANEAEILLAYADSEAVIDRTPIAWKWNDPIESARFIFDRDEYDEIKHVDENLLVGIEVCEASFNFAMRHNDNPRGSWAGDYIVTAKDVNHAKRIMNVLSGSDDAWDESGFDPESFDYDEKHLRDHLWVQVVNVTNKPYLVKVVVWAGTIQKKFFVDSYSKAMEIVDTHHNNSHDPQFYDSEENALVDTGFGLCTESEAAKPSPTLTV
jgi:hypothetical protein